MAISFCKPKQDTDSGTISPFGTNAFHCCQWYGVAVEDLWVVSPTYITKAVEARYDIRQISAVRAILELVFIRSGCFELTRVMVRAFLHAKLIDAFIQFLCAS